MTFPGLEVSLFRAGDFGLFVPVVPAIDIDVGHNARLREIHIDGLEKRRVAQEPMGPSHKMVGTSSRSRHMALISNLVGNGKWEQGWWR